jgi:hypothetical protein
MALPSQRHTGLPENPMGGCWAPVAIEPAHGPARCCWWGGGLPIAPSAPPSLSSSRRTTMVEPLPLPLRTLTAKEPVRRVLSVLPAWTLIVMVGPPVVASDCAEVVPCPA